MWGNCKLGRGLRRGEKIATEGCAGPFEKTSPDARAAPPEAHESLIGRKTVEEVPLTGLSSVYRAAAELGLAIGRDLSVIGFADLREASMLEPALTTIRQDARAIGMKAAELLLDRIEGRFTATKPR